MGGMLAWLGFEPSYQAEIYQTISQALLGVLAAGVAFLLIHKGQNTSAEENRRIERARILHDLDREYENIMAKRCVVANAASLQFPDFRIGDPSGRSPLINNNTVDAKDLCLFELVLTRHVLWLAAPGRSDNNGPNQYIYVNGARHAQVAPGYYVDTLTLHRVVSWSKRVASGLHAKIIDREDVCDMWRHILPWAKDNRFSFMAAFFGVSRDIKIEAGARPGNVGSSKAFPGWKRRSPFSSAIPQQWSGDVAPLYFLIRTVLEEAYTSRRVEILHFVGLDKELFAEVTGADESMEARMDPMVRLVLGLDPSASEGSDPAIEADREIT